MSLAFENALEVLFADPNIGVEAIYTSDGGAPVLVGAVARRADAVSDFGDARLWSEGGLGFRGVEFSQFHLLTLAGSCAALPHIRNGPKGTTAFPILPD
jgi:hypothetical protein